MTKPVVLCILDGWGYRAESRDNAIALANTPNWDRLWQTAAHSLLETSGLAVGLPDGQMGNSEVGHLTIGAGRVVYQDLPKITQAMKTGELNSNATLRNFMTRIKATGGAIHLMGLTSPGGVHAHQDHMLGLARIIASEVPVAVHVFTDGRDVAPQSAAAQIKSFNDALPANAAIQSISGRYYAMDRDKRWERVEAAYRAMVEGKSPENFTDPIAAIEASYENGVTDEFIVPTARSGYAGMKSGDGVLFANFRADRARQTLGALLDPDFTGFARPALTLHALGMVEYSNDLNLFMPALFPPKELVDTLGEVVSQAGLKQLRLAETEKYAHVTFFLNGGEEKVSKGEERILIPSPKVATYDLQPEMSAAEVARQCCMAITGGQFDLIVVNFANPDMVGHSGILAAAIKAVESVDVALGQLLMALEHARGAMLITADHGNCEQMFDDHTHGPHTSHSLNKVPAVLIGHPGKLHDGSLADIAPTLLQLIGLPQPKAMTGKSLLET